MKLHYFIDWWCTVRPLCLIYIQVSQGRAYPCSDPPHVEALVFLEGLMRICFGDRILKLKRVEDLEKLYNRRKNGKAEVVQRAWETHSSAGLAKVWKSIGNNCS